MNNKHFLARTSVVGILVAFGGTLTAHSAPMHAPQHQATTSCDAANFETGTDGGKYNLGYEMTIGITGNNNTVDAKTCGKLTVNGDSNIITIDGGTSRSIYISGRHNTIILQGGCMLLRIDWDHNSVKAGELCDIQLIGNHNAVTGETITPSKRPAELVMFKRAPVWVCDGNNQNPNGGGNHHPRPDPDPDMANLKGVLIKGTNNRVTLSGGSCDTIKVSGVTNAVSMEGVCQTLYIAPTAQNVDATVDTLTDLQLAGNQNSVHLDRASGGTISGNDNTVVYQHGVGRGKISVSQRFTVTGQRDTVKRVVPPPPPVR